MSSRFASSSEALRKARARASVARTIEANVLHTAIYDAKEAGLSIRQTAKALQIPIGTAVRHWHIGHNCPAVVPTWGNPDEWRDAHAAVWSHDSGEAADDHLPWQWHHRADGSIEVSRNLRSGGIARLHTPD